MIRRDYFMRMVQELCAVLARAAGLRQQEQYSEALHEIATAWRRYGIEDEQFDTWSLEEWITFCREAGEVHAEKLLAVADLLAEQAGVLATLAQLGRSQHASAMALGLYLEVLHRSVVSVDLIQKAEALIERTADQRLPSEVLKRLLSYYEARGMLAKAEDVLFDWLDSKHPEAGPAGFGFYERLGTKSDAELEEGGLTRNEIQEGKDLWQQKIQGSVGHASA